MHDRDMAACGSAGPSTKGDEELRRRQRELEQLEFDRSLARQLHAYADRVNATSGRHEHPGHPSEVEGAVAEVRKVADRMMRWTEVALNGGPRY